MVLCFATQCSHHSSDGRCKFFRFPAGKRNVWERLCRRADRRVGETDRLCSCHFKEGKKENGPTIFAWNQGKVFDFPDASCRPKKRKVKEAYSYDGPSSSSVSQHQIPNTECDDVALEAQVGSSKLIDHSYSCTSSALQDRFDKMTSQIQSYEEQIQGLEKQLKTLKLAKSTLTVDDIKHSDVKMLLYTSFTYDVFEILEKLLGRFTLNYYYGWRVTSVPLKDQLLLTLMKLRLGSQDVDLAERFSISHTTVQNIFHTLLHALHELLFLGIMSKGMPSQLKCRGSMPQSFNDFVSARAVVDATEITQDVPSDLNKQSDCYSSYKSRHTAKAVTCVAPNAAIVYVSELYPGSVSDVSIVEHSKMLDQFVPGDLILADKGFTLFSRLPKGVSLNIPPFLTGKAFFTKQEADLCFKIGKARIHVERANERIKNYEILDHIPFHLRPIATKIFQVCCCLVNLQAPLLKEIADQYEM